MSKLNKKSWWYRASKDQKLAQIDGGIECGICAKHIAMNVGATVSAAQEFGRYHGRKFSGKNTIAQNRIAGGIAGISNARRLGKPDCEISSAFSIFEDASSEQPMFDEVAA